MATSPPAPGPPALGLPAWAWVALALGFGFVYLRGIASDPLRSDELRPALVTHEMMTRGDYVVPRLLGEPDLGQPPLQSWLIALFSGGHASRVGPLSIRLPSVLAVGGIALLLARLGISASSGPHALPALVFLSFGVLPQLGRTGEVDLLAGFWVIAALAAFELGRRRASGWLQWVVAQALLAAGALTQGLAPALFHAPALLTTWRRRLPPRPLAFVFGFVLMLALTLLWVVPYARSSSAYAVVGALSTDVARRTTAGGGIGHHLARYPLGVLAAAAPWSLVPLALVVPRARTALRGLLQDPWLALGAFSVGWTVLVLAFARGVEPRELIPALPATATLVAAALARLDRPARPAWPWIALATAWAGFVLLSGRAVLLAPPEPRPARLTAALVGLGLLGIAAAWQTARRFGAASAALLAAGLLYGLVYAGVSEARAARRQEALAATAEALAPYLRPEVPVVVRKGTDRKLTWLLVRRLDRLVVERAPAPPYDLVAPSDVAIPNARFMFESGGYSVWRVRVPSRL